MDLYFLKWWILHSKRWTLRVGACAVGRAAAMGWSTLRQEKLRQRPLGTRQNAKNEQGKSSFGSILVKTTSLSGHRSRFGTTYSAQYTRHKVHQFTTTVFGPILGLFWVYFGPILWRIQCPEQVYTDGVRALGNDSFIVYAGGADQVGILYSKWWILYSKWWIVYSKRWILYSKWWIMH